jgi:hypothetical protein
MKQLWENACICSGHVSRTFTMPGSNQPHHNWVPEKKQKVEEDTGPKIGKKETLRLQKALGKPL